MGSFLFYLLSFIVALGILITVHEFGHFWVARKLGVKVLRFSVGFGRPLWRRVSPVDGTEYVVAVIPLGGYVKMLDEREEPVPEEELPGSFNQKSVWVRTAIVAAGPFSNFLFAVVALWFVSVVGDVGLRPVIGEVETDSAAYYAGFEPGDEILEIGGTRIQTWESAIYALLSTSIEGEGDPGVRVRGEMGMERLLFLSSEAMEGLTEKDNPVKSLGMSPLRPVLPPVIGRLLEGEAAIRAGLKTGDRVLSVDGLVPDDWVALVKMIQARPGQTALFEVERGGRIQVVEVEIGVVKSDDGKKRGFIGVEQPPIPEDILEQYQVQVRLGPLDAMGASLAKTWDLSFLVLKMMGRMLTGEASIKNLSGPITIAQVAGKSASYGVIPFIKFLAWISISLGVLNLLPIPILDGGHLLYFLVEGIKGAPLSEQAQAWGQQLGLVLLILLMGLAFYTDLSRLLG